MFEILNKEYVKMNMVDKLLAAVEQLAVRKNRINTLVDTFLDHIVPHRVAMAGNCWTQTECTGCHGNTKSCRDRECCDGTGCGPWGGWYQVGCTP